MHQHVCYILKFCIQSKVWVCRNQVSRPHANPCQLLSLQFPQFLLRKNTPLRPLHHCCNSCRLLPQKHAFSSFTKPTHDYLDCCAQCCHSSRHCLDFRCHRLNLWYRRTSQTITCLIHCGRDLNWRGKAIISLCKSCLKTNSGTKWVCNWVCDLNQGNWRWYSIVTGQ